MRRRSQTEFIRHSVSCRDRLDDSRVGAGESATEVFWSISNVSDGSAHRFRISSADLSVDWEEMDECNDLDQIEATDEDWKIILEALVVLVGQTTVRSIRWLSKVCCATVK